MCHGFTWFTIHIIFNEFLMTQSFVGLSSGEIFASSWINLGQSHLLLLAKVTLYSFGLIIGRLATIALLFKIDFQAIFILPS